MPPGLRSAQPRRLWARLREARADLRSANEQTEAILEQVREATLSADQAAAALEACRHELHALRSELAQTTATLEQDHQRTLLALRMVRDDDVAARSALWALRSSAGYEAAYDESEPLVTIIISTYSNWPLLRDRSLPSILAQTYEHWETIVVGDDAPPEAKRAVGSFGDERIRFVNLPYRGPYPADRSQAWMVSGTTPWNTGLALAGGRWIGTNGDDDALRPTYIESLLAHARANRAEVPYGYIEQVEPDGPATRLGTFPPVHSQWGLQASLLHAGLRFMPMQPNDWVFGIPNDSSLLERMLRIGVRFSLLEEPVVDYYPSSLWSNHGDRGTLPEA
jgi:hypothetical protein